MFPHVYSLCAKVTGCWQKPNIYWTDNGIDILIKLSVTKQNQSKMLNFSFNRTSTDGNTIDMSLLKEV